MVDDKPVKSPPKVDPEFEEPLKAMIEDNPLFGSRTVAGLLGFKVRPRTRGGQTGAHRRIIQRNHKIDGYSSWTGLTSVAICNK